jgi:hypothetical protein
MKNATLIVGLLASVGVLAGGGWQLGQSPTSEVLNGITYPNESYAFAVGINGSIVQFQAGDNGSLMTSGTSNDLYDVFANSGNAAIAAGEDVVLVWDGSSWTPIVENDDGTIYTGVWMTPENDAMFYESLGVFNFVCPYHPGADPQPWCRGYQNPVMTYCGQSGDIKMFTSDGDIHWVDNFLTDLTDDFMPIHEEPVPLNLTAIWAPEWVCLPGSIEPIDVFAIQNNNNFFRFYGSEWVNMNVNVPNDHVLTWIGGANPNEVTAVGYKPDGQGGNAGVVWHFDGSSWTEDQSLPNGTVGLTDIAYNTGLPNLIFTDGFELSTSPFAITSEPGLDILAMAEEGEFISSRYLFPQGGTDISVKKTLLTPEPIRQGDTITFELQILNLSTEDIPDVRITDGFIDIYMELANDGCGFTATRADSFWTYHMKTLTTLSAGELITCQMTFTVTGNPGFNLHNSVNAYSYSSHEINHRNNHSLVKSLIYPSTN